MALERVDLWAQREVFRPPTRLARLRRAGTSSRAAIARSGRSARVPSAAARAHRCPRNDADSRPSDHNGRRRRCRRDPRHGRRAAVGGGRRPSAPGSGARSRADCPVARVRELQAETAHRAQHVALGRRTIRANRGRGGCRVAARGVAFVDVHVVPRRRHRSQPERRESCRPKGRARRAILRRLGPRPARAPRDTAPAPRVAPQSDGRAGRTPPHAASLPGRKCAEQRDEQGRRALVSRSRAFTMVCPRLEFPSDRMDLSGEPGAAHRPNSGGNMVIRLRRSASSASSRRTSRFRISPGASSRSATSPMRKHCSSCSGATTVRS